MLVVVFSIVFLINGLYKEHISIGCFHKINLFKVPVFVGIGLGVAFQGIYAFSYISFLTPDWERKLIEKRLNRKL